MYSNAEGGFADRIIPQTCINLGFWMLKIDLILLILFIAVKEAAIWFVYCHQSYSIRPPR